MTALPTWIDPYCNWCGAEGPKLRRTADDSAICRICAKRYQIETMEIIR
jgi:hypothetical protein